jgi:hypothetical protein
MVIVKNLSMLIQVNQQNNKHISLGVSKSIILLGR